ncbi:hypothetical protein PPACK8108_LOCUS22770 [Phakopsora pachyrhizi]|uniref:Rieske domain-containing protein n=1 Tax=Phakopsora pachyrhizi TaxID=170000 RepID=A0AAV0BNH4_PHAPC|nr:hypothetical protein PPACK8108_LOCUS22770 [Phakopsora pachyrhizi]
MINTFCLASRILVRQNSLYKARLISFNHKEALFRYLFSTSTVGMSNYLRLDAGTKSDWKDGMMKEIPLDPKDEKSVKVLVSQIQGKFFATSAKCTHYGAPLVKGILGPDGCVTCPWHGAKFSICKDGDIEDAPGLNSLQAFEVIIEGDKIFVSVDADQVKKTEFGRPPKKCRSVGHTDKHGLIVIGGGSGGHFLAEEVRNLDYNGKVTLVSKEPYLPIDRDEAFYKDSDIDIKIGTTVESIDLEKQVVKLSDGSSLGYSKLVVATGATPRALPVEGANLKGIHTLRGVADAQNIESELNSNGGSRKTIVFVGSSFISMELAVFASKRDNLDIHVIGMEKAPLARVLGEKIGGGLRKFHEKNGIKFHLESGVEKFIPSETDSSRVGGVILKGGSVLKCDGVVLGVGAKPNTDLLSSAGIKLEKDSSVAVDEYLRVKDAKAKNLVYAIGDIATFPDLLTDGSLTRIEHWNVAGNHARTAARNITNEQKSKDLVAFSKPAVFWSAQGQQLRYVGTGKASQWTDVVINGNPDELKFVAYFHKGEEVVAIATMQKDPVMAQAAELLNRKKFPPLSEIQKTDLLEFKL